MRLLGSMFELVLEGYAVSKHSPKDRGRKLASNVRVKDSELYRSSMRPICFRAIVSVQYLIFLEAIWTARCLEGYGAT